MVEGADGGVARGQPSARLAALVEDGHGQAGAAQHASAGQPGNTGADDGHAVDHAEAPRTRARSQRIGAPTTGSVS